MEKYESVIILKPDLLEQEISEVILRVEDTIKKFGEVTNKDDLGIRKLAYEIKKNKKGHYIVYQFKVNEEKSVDAVRELERIYRIIDEIIKFIVVRIDEEKR